MYSFVLEWTPALTPGKFSPSFTVLFILPLRKKFALISVNSKQLVHFGSHCIKKVSYTFKLKYVFPIGGERVTCVIGQKSRTPLGNNNLNFRNQVVLLETVANFGATWRQAKHFFRTFFALVLRCICLKEP